MKVVHNGNTLCDDAATPKVLGIIEQLGGRAAVQREQVYGAANEFLAARGNVGGRFVFTAFCSYASYALASAAFKAAYALIGVSGSCVLTYPTGTTITMAGAVLADVSRVEWDGVGLKLRYTIEITTAV